MAATILIVDDEPQIIALLSLTFQLAGYVVRTAPGGRTAIDLCSLEHFDVVLSDVMMPEIDGNQLAAWLAVHRPTTCIALMSGFDGACNKVGVPLIAKPFRTQEVVSFVDRALATSRRLQCEAK